MHSNCLPQLRRITLSVHYNKTEKTNNLPIESVNYCNEYYPFQTRKIPMPVDE